MFKKLAPQPASATRADLLQQIENANDALGERADLHALASVARRARQDAEIVKANALRMGSSASDMDANTRLNFLLGSVEADFNKVIIAQLFDCPEVHEAEAIIAPLELAIESAKAALCEFDGAAERARQNLRDKLEAARCEALQNPEIRALEQEVAAFQ